MRDLVELTDEKLTELTAKQRLRLVTAAGVLAVCAALSLRSIVALFIDPNVPALPGMSHPVGQIAWAVLLIAMLAAVSWLIRGVLRRRLQFAVTLSLLLHFLLCLSVSTVSFTGNDKQNNDASTPLPRKDEWSLPDYALDEHPESEPAWIKPNDTATPENEVEAERKLASIAQPEKPAAELPVEEAEPTPAETPERQEQVAMNREAPAEMDRSNELREGPLEPLKPVDSPTVEPVESKTPEVELTAAEMQRTDSALPEVERSQVEQAVARIESEMNARTPSASRTEASAELSGEQPDLSNPRRDPAVTPASSTADMISNLPTVETPAAPRVIARERRLENARQQSQLAERRASSALPRSNVADNRPQKASVPQSATREAANVANSNLPDGGPAAMSRRAGSAPSVASSRADDVSVAEATRQRDLTPTSTAGASGSPRRETSRSLPAATNNRTSTAPSQVAASDSPTRAARPSGRTSSGDSRPVIGASGDRSAGTPLNARTDRSGSGDGSEVTSGLNADAGEVGDLPTARRAGVSSRSPAANGSGSGKGSGSGDAVDGMLAGPGSGNVGRQQSQLPATGGANGIGSARGSSNNAGDGSGDEGFAPTSSIVGGRGIGAGSGRDDDARLGASDGFADGGGSLNLDRSGVGNGIDLSGLPAGAEGAEQSGQLVMAGPQASGSGGAGSNSVGSNGAAANGTSNGNVGGTTNGRTGSDAGKGPSSGIAGLAGPRGTGVGRRSAGLPGSAGSGTGGPSSSLASASSSDGTGGKAALIGSPRRGAGADRPSLGGGDSSLSSLVKRSAGVSGGPVVAALPERLSLRTADGRREAAKSLGGSQESEDAVERGLEWLARNQHADGHWSIHDFPGDNDQNPGNFESDTAATGLALLAFLGAGYTHESGKYDSVVKKGMTWLLERQKPNGDLFAETSEFVHFYSHGIASIAVCEAYGMTKDAALKEPAQRAINYIIESQHPEFGGWRYRPRFESDTSVSGWQLMALKSAEVAGLKVPIEVYRKVNGWLDSVERPGGQYSYHPTKAAGLAMTAEGLLMRQYLGVKRSDAKLTAGAQFLSTRPPNYGERDAYYWYYATQVMFHMQGELWQEWNNALRDTLVKSQELNGDDRGSWNPTAPVSEKWSAAGGRHYLTCLNLLMLEVYYRHLPLYEELGK